MQPAYCYPPRAMGHAARRGADHAATRVANDPNLVLVVRPDDLPAWTDRAATGGYAARLVASPIVIEPGGATVLQHDALWVLRTARTP